MPKPKRKQASGGARMAASGKRPVLLGVYPDDHAILAAAAEIEKRPVTQFLLYHGVVAAKKILKESEKKT